MFVRRLILCVALLFGCYQSAVAAPSCDGVDNILRSVSILRDIQTDQTDRYYAQNISELNITLSLISLPALQPNAYTEAFPEQALALSLYISNLREAVSKASLGDRSAAKILLSQPVPSGLSDGIGSMGRYWACDVSETFETEGLASSDTSTFKNGSSSTSGETQTDSISEPASNAPSSGKTAPARTLGKSISNGPKLDIKGNPILFIAMVLVVIGIIYGGRKYSKRSRLRDHRYLIHHVTRFKVGKKLYDMTIMDITPRGLKFKHDGLIQRQRKVSIELNGNWHSCRLVWKNPNFAGAKFRRALQDKTMEALLADAHHEGKDTGPQNTAPINALA